MMRSLYSGVSGLQNHQTRMDVIGNNVANVNTTGFKKGRVTFQDIISQMVSGAAKPTMERGGINAKQVGLGMNIASIDTLMTQGSFQTTGKNTDVAISGEGFYVLKDGQNTYFTRNGNFMIDRNGTLVNSNGLRVQGWQSRRYAGGEYLIDTNAPTTDLKIEQGQKVEAVETTAVRFRSNLDSNAIILPPNATEAERVKATHGASIDVFDAYGNPWRLSATFERTDLNTWRANMMMTDAMGNQVQNLRVSVGAAKLDTDNQLMFNFNTNGTVSSIAEAAGIAQETDAETQLSGIVTYDHPDGTQRTFNVNFGEVGSVKNTITQFASRFTTEAYEQDGNGMGYMESFIIDDTGIITGVMDNGVRRPLGQMSTAAFVNPMGLEKQGTSLYAQSNNSGAAMIGRAGSQGRGKMLVGALEMSNVDLSETFTDMIVTERGFQANSRTITTSDQMLQEVLNLKR